ncbi:aspartate 4-decarboxylase [Murinocardiopsis flavida]|uniref:Aminotransferase n=1 Tax=Murinocardiopsis flavida TaxID=645275 RepID=A0A2P8DFC4_9ACTN|nr:bifunctional aspartate transaminase/aspartate 4-decarboxylase [Murinocardiopsis flavida]PSK95910.1 aspartate 4-decarboxylase [Murinocardiopsis flavida]
MTDLETSREEQRRLESLSPFELKGSLIALAGEHKQKDAHAMLNAGRGNPNWTATPPRDAFFLLGRFAVRETKRDWDEWPAVGGMPRADGIAERLSLFVDQNAGEEGADLLRRMLNRVAGDGADAFVHEFVDGIIGDNYPVPDRILPNVAGVVHEYLMKVLCDGRTPDRPYELFATEGGTAAMCYIFDSLQVNGVLNKGDRIALMTPIFTPYLEIPELERYSFDVTHIAASRDTDQGFHTWQYDDAEIDRLADPAIRLLCLVNPSNPPSVMLSPRTLDRIREIVETRNRDLVIVTDDVYGTFVDGFTSILAAAPRNTIGVYSFSKYFGATGWRLGAIALHPDNVIDEQIARLGATATEALHKRYSSISLDPAGLAFIDRMVADSRSVALNHTAGLSTPQQVQMALFALFDLTYAAGEYQDIAKEVIHRRLAALAEGAGVHPPHNALQAGYYVELDLLSWAERTRGAEFAAWMRANYEPVDPIFRLAQNDSVVLLNGGGFDGPEWSVRVSMANLTHEAYEQIGRDLHEIGEYYYARFTDERGRA